jgi:tRNA-specific 2-thiouridylase
VLEVRPGTREVVVGPAEALAAAGVEVAGVSWLGEPPAPGEELLVQIRHRAAPVAARLEEARSQSLAEPSRLALTFVEPQRSVTPGQSAVLFQGERVLGGGRIQSALRRGASRAT